jgi:hypothetical protein
MRLSRSKKVYQQINSSPGPQRADEKRTERRIEISDNLFDHPSSDQMTKQMLLPEEQMQR